MIFGLLFIVIGLINAISPATGWYLSYGWRYKDAEPSDAAYQKNSVSNHKPYRNYRR